jgi:hypothetical protein
MSVFENEFGNVSILKLCWGNNFTSAFYFTSAFAEVFIHRTMCVNLLYSSFYHDPVENTKPVIY